jgi:class 3 adenylate cyclase
MGATLSGEHVERRLAAILAADVAGYSRLMAADEVGALTALKVHRREVVDPAIAAHHGRIVKTTGDGMLVEFASAVDAMTCAMTVSRAILDLIPRHDDRAGWRRGRRAQRAATAPSHIAVRQGGRQAGPVSCMLL